MTTHEIGQRAPSRHARRKRRRNYGPVIILALVCAAIFTAGYCVGVSAADKAVPTLPEPVLESTATPEPSAEPSVAPTPSPTPEAVLWRDDIVTDGNLLDYDLQVTMQACCEEYGVPYALALAVADVESRFDPDAASSTNDYLQLPDFIQHEIPVMLDPKAKKAYDQFERDLLLEVDEDIITAGTAGVLVGKLLQFCNGAVYGNDGKVVPVHDCKLEAYTELLEQLNGEHCLTFYGYQHDKDRILERLEKYNRGRADKLRVRVYKGVEDEEAWNAGEVDVLLVHPASCAYGLNLQAGGRHVVWYGLNWSFELNDQGNCRLYRQGSPYDGIICDGSIRSGKTVAMTVGFIMWAMCRFQGQNFALCGKTIESLRRNVTTNLPTWLAGVFSFREYRTENKIVVSAAGRSNNFYLFGGRDESSASLIQGITLAGVLLDEVALMPRSFVEQACARCSVEGSKLWFNCNPEGPSHWFYLTWVLEAAKRNMLHLHFTMDDNLSLSASVKAR